MFETRNRCSRHAMASQAQLLSPQTTQIGKATRRCRQQPASRKALNVDAGPHAQVAGSCWPPYVIFGKSGVFRFCYFGLMKPPASLFAFVRYTGLPFKYEDHSLLLSLDGCIDTPVWSLLPYAFAASFSSESWRK